MKVTVYMTTTASLTIDVEIPDDTDPTEAEDKAIEKAYDEMPGDLCIQCTGWRKTWSRELGEWGPCEGEGQAIHIHEG